MPDIRVDPKTGAMTAGGDPTRTGYARVIAIIGCWTRSPGAMMRRA
jgi:hypothetical protein